MQKIGIGYEDYKRMIDDDCYYIDKTSIIRNIVEMGGMVTLFTRPRRFGKTLALSTIRTFLNWSMVMMEMLLITAITLKARR